MSYQHSREYILCSMNKLNSEKNYIDVQLATFKRQLYEIDNPPPPPTAYEIFGDYFGDIFKPETKQSKSRGNI